MRYISQILVKDYLVHTKILVVLPRELQSTTIQKSQRLKIITVKDVVNKDKPTDPMKKMAQRRSATEEEVLEEDQIETTEEVVSETEEYDIEEDVNALLGGEELSEEFREKAKTIFEAFSSKVREIQETLETQYLRSWLKKPNHSRVNFKSVLIPILSMSKNG